MKRPHTDQLRERLESIARLEDRGYVDNHTMIGLGLVATDALINIAESLEDIAASLDRL